MVIDGVTAEIGGKVVQELTVVGTTTIGTATAVEIAIEVGIAIAIEMILDATLPGYVTIGDTDGIVDSIAPDATLEVSDL